MAYAKSGQLAAGVVTTVTVKADGSGIQLVNRSQSGEIWVRMDGTDPVVKGDDSFAVLGVRHFPTRTGEVEVRMISSGTPEYSVEGLVIVA